jgi:PAS domain S-box-containing protein
MPVASIGSDLLAGPPTTPFLRSGTMESSGGENRNNAGLESVPAPGKPPAGRPAEAHLLLEAFETFTKASDSLEYAFQQLQARAERLSKELDARNRELKKSLREKAEAQNYLKTILERLPCGVLVLDVQGNVMLCNPVAGDLLGEPGSKTVRRLARGRPLKKEALRSRLAASVSPASGKEIEVPVELAGGTRVCALSGTPLTNASGKVQGTLHIIRDITDFKALEEQNKRSERLSAMGEMAVELAHEIRNPLGGIELFASLLEKELPKDSDPGRWSGNILVGSRSLNNIVSNMLHFANPLAPTFGSVDIHQVIREILGFMQPIMCQREVQVFDRLGANNPVIAGDRELLKQMILNLVHNSMQAMPTQGSLTVSSRDLPASPGTACGDGLEFSVRDTGLGIPSDNIARIFDPFFTTNRNGTGLGLSVVHQIVDRHAGVITVTSEINRGTVFTVSFPKSMTASNAA